MIIQCCDLIAHLGVRESRCVSILLSSRAQNSRASSWILLGCSTSISNSICPKVYLSFHSCPSLHHCQHRPPPQTVLLLRHQDQRMGSSFIDLLNRSHLQVILHDFVILQIQPTPLFPAMLFSPSAFQLALGANPFSIPLHCLGVGLLTHLYSKTTRP